MSKKQKYKKKEVDDWSKSEDVYTLHKKRSNKFDRNQIVVNGIDDTWQIDLCDMRALKNENNNYFDSD